MIMNIFFYKHIVYKHNVWIYWKNEHYGSALNFVIVFFRNTLYPLSRISIFRNFTPWNSMRIFITLWNFQVYFLPPPEIFQNFKPPGIPLSSILRYRLFLEKNLCNEYHKYDPSYWLFLTKAKSYQSMIFKKLVLSHSISPKSWIY